MWATVSAAHDIRDGKFGDAARKRAVDTGERYNLIVVGGGISGLGAAAFFQKLKGGRARARQPSKLVKDAFGTGFNETPWSEQLRADFVKWRSSPRVYDGNDLARWFDTMTSEACSSNTSGSTPPSLVMQTRSSRAPRAGSGSDVISAQCAGQI